MTTEYKYARELYQPLRGIRNTLEAISKSNEVVNGHQWLAFFEQFDKLRRSMLFCPTSSLAVWLESLAYAPCQGHCIDATTECEVAQALYDGTRTALACVLSTLMEQPSQWDDVLVWFATVRDTCRTAGHNTFRMRFRIYPRWHAHGSSDLVIKEMLSCPLWAASRDPGGGINFTAPSLLVVMTVLHRMADVVIAERMPKAYHWVDVDGPEPPEETYPSQRSCELTLPGVKDPTALTVRLLEHAKAHWKHKPHIRRWEHARWTFTAMTDREVYAIGRAAVGQHATAGVSIQVSLGLVYP